MGTRSIFWVWVHRRDKNVMRYEEYYLFWAKSTITDTLPWHHTSKSEGFCQVHDAGILFGTQLCFLGSSPDNFIDVYSFSAGWWSYYTLLHKRELSSVFPFPLKSHGKWNTRIKSPLHVFFIWCEKGSKSICKKKRRNLSRAVGALGGWKTLMRTVWRDWDQEVQCQGTSFLIIAVPLQSQASLHTMIIKIHFPKAGHA